MYFDHHTKALPDQAGLALTDPTFLHYRAGYLDGHAAGYCQGAAAEAENDTARAEHAARLFYAMTAEDADRRRLAQSAASAIDVAEARRQADEWARRNCAYPGGPVDFFTGRPLRTERRAA